MFDIDIVCEIDNETELMLRRATQPTPGMKR